MPQMNLIAADAFLHYQRIFNVSTHQRANVAVLANLSGGLKSAVLEKLVTHVKQSPDKRSSFKPPRKGAIYGTSSSIA